MHTCIDTCIDTSIYTNTRKKMHELVHTYSNTLHVRINLFLSHAHIEKCILRGRHSCLLNSIQAYVHQNPRTSSHMQQYITCKNLSISVACAVFSIQTFMSATAFRHTCAKIHELVAVFSIHSYVRQCHTCEM